MTATRRSKADTSPVNGLSNPNVVPVKGNVLREVRRARGMSMEGLAKAAGVSWLTVQRLEDGRQVKGRTARVRGAQLETVTAIAGALGVPNDLLRLAGD